MRTSRLLTGSPLLVLPLCVHARHGTTYPNELNFRWMFCTYFACPIGVVIYSRMTHLLIALPNFLQPPHHLSISHVAAHMYRSLGVNE